MNLSLDCFSNFRFVGINEQGEEIDIPIKSAVSKQDMIIFKLQEIDFIVYLLHLILSDLTVQTWPVNDDIKGSIHVTFEVKSKVTVHWSKRK